MCFIKVMEREGLFTHWLSSLESCTIQIKWYQIQVLQNMFPKWNHPFTDVYPSDNWNVRSCNYCISQVYIIFWIIVTFIIPCFYSHSKISGLNFSFVNWNCNVLTHETRNYICPTYNKSSLLEYTVLSGKSKTVQEQQAATFAKCFWSTLSSIEYTVSTI